MKIQCSRVRASVSHRRAWVSVEGQGPGSTWSQRLVEKKLVLPLVTTPRRQKTPKEDMLLPSAPQGPATAGSQVQRCPKRKFPLKLLLQILLRIPLRIPSQTSSDSPSGTSTCNRSDRKAVTKAAPTHHLGPQACLGVYIHLL